MDYFCYVSRSKVDQLYANISSEPDKYTEVQTTESTHGGNFSGGLSISAIINLFKGGITYGRKGVIQREQQIKTTYVEKLRRVLMAICREGPVPFFSPSASPAPTKSVYFHHRGKFRVVAPFRHEAPSETVVAIKTELGQHALFLDCSLRFFSEGNEPDGTFHVHSGNNRFFAGDIDLLLETVFILLDQKGSEYFGTPLYLRLSTNDDKSLAGAIEVSL